MRTTLRPFALLALGAALIGAADAGRNLAQKLDYIKSLGHNLRPAEMRAHLEVFKDAALPEGLRRELEDFKRSLRGAVSGGAGEQHPAERWTPEWTSGNGDDIWKPHPAPEKRGPGRKARRRRQKNKSSGLTNVKLTYYWIAIQTKDDVGKVALRTCDGKYLGSASKDFADKVSMEGTGRLLNGKLINLGDCKCPRGYYNCFMDLTGQSQYGFGEDDIQLLPWVSVANNDDEYAMGSFLYAPALDGVVLPNGQKHNGCLQKVDSIGRGGEDRHIDFFIRDEFSMPLFEEALRGAERIDVEWNTERCNETSFDFSR